MELTIRPVTADEARDFLTTLGIGFGFDIENDDEVTNFLETFELDRSRAAFDGSTIVGTLGAFSLQLTVPGGERVPTGGTTMVTVRPTHRRQGVLRAMMAAHLEDVRDRGEPLAALWASETPIYGRFGFGHAVDKLNATVPRHRSGFVTEPATNGRVRLLTVDEAKKVFPAIHDRAIRRRAGTYARTEAWWNARTFYDPPSWREGWTAKRYAVLERNGEAIGYAIFRVKENWEDGLPQGKLRVSELFADDAEAEKALWAFLTGVDLIGTIEHWNLPVDHPLPRWLENSRAAKRTVGDSLWVRIVDLTAALTARRYRHAGSLVLHVEDGACPWNHGTWLLEVDADGIASVEATDATPDLELDIRELGALYLGGFDASMLAEAGLIAGDAAALRVADDLFRWTPAPWCPEVF